MEANVRRTIAVSPANFAVAKCAGAGVQAMARNAAPLGVDLHDTKIK